MQSYWELSLRTTLASTINSQVFLNVAGNVHIYLNYFGQGCVAVTFRYRISCTYYALRVTETQKRMINAFLT